VRVYILQYYIEPLSVSASHPEDGDCNVSRNLGIAWVSKFRSRSHTWDKECENSRTRILDHVGRYTRRTKAAEMRCASRSSPSLSGRTVHVYSGTELQWTRREEAVSVRTNLELKCLMTFSFMPMQHLAHYFSDRWLIITYNLDVSQEETRLLQILYPRPITDRSSCVYVAQKSMKLGLYLTSIPINKNRLNLIVNKIPIFDI
jgi:hypothetical protein